MASLCVRVGFTSRRPLFSLRSCLKPRASPVPPSPSTHFSRPGTRPSASARPLTSLPRCPSELGCCSGSLFPLHSVIAAASLTSCLSSPSRSLGGLSQDGLDGS